MLGRSGIILYKTLWTDAERVGAFLERYEARPPGARLRPSPTAQLELHARDETMFMGRLEVNGQRAAEEFKKATEFWAEQARRMAKERREPPAPRVPDSQTAEA